MGLTYVNAIPFKGVFLCKKDYDVQFKTIQTSGAGG
jgi:hypothetical protein